jgi:hypothetical protein
MRMNPYSSFRPAPLLHKAWVAVRFVVFGFAGFWVMLGFTMAFLMRVFMHDQHVMNPFLSFPLAVAGAFMMLFGVGEWGRWRYLLVFVSIPAAFIGSSYLYDWIFPDSPKPLGPFVIATVAAFLTHRAVRAYYARRARQQASLQLHDCDT